MLRGCVKYLDGIFGVGKIVFVEQTAVIFCLFLNVFQKMQSVKCISGHYSSLWCDKKAISELSQISMGVIMTCKYPEKSWGFKLRDHSHLVNDWHQMKYVLPGCSAILYDEWSFLPAFNIFPNNVCHQVWLLEMNCSPFFTITCWSTHFTVGRTEMRPFQKAGFQNSEFERKLTVVNSEFFVSGHEVGVCLINSESELTRVMRTGI